VSARRIGAALLTGALFAVAACSSSSTPTTNAGATCRPPPGGTEPYPAETGCGTEPGQTLANYSFQGRASGISSPRGTIKFSDYYDPTGTKYTYLVINVSAIWCTYCKQEAPQLAQMNQTYGPHGVVFLTVVEQDASRAPATDADVDNWITAYGLVTPAVSDPNQVMTSFFNPDLMPLNMIIDAKTMQIVKKITGSGLPQVQAELNTRLGITP
jgi:thiol-disulfide isomerase/thioredoxin